ncbi:multiple epidermal growth factor-like domains protein 11 [Mytilus californianus]|uniref:multiple epidermal growth factor-like domains protein 11 n=1 Tax=Mytilus californianus TaxID=6549 RepID=UPI0022451A9A|nr:multiple epidermal growth factor-like domains protein 11 [Mytilus californianus]
MNGFSLYMSNGTVDAGDKLLCYTDLLITELPNTTQDIDCCPLGTYGVYCGMKCSENCISGSCDLVSGHCTFGCTDGWVACSEGLFGNQCVHTCSSHCVKSSCNHVTGECNGGCKQGWTAYDCSEECSTGYFGRNCSQSCEGCLSDLCDRFAGFCNVTDKCKPGYIHDLKCNQACEHMYYGDNCTEKCNCLSRLEPCDKSTGMCPDGKCDKGWSGESCNKECSEGYYGSNCIDYCNNCLNTSCEIFEGNCTYGCNNKFSGPQCTKADLQSLEERGLVTAIIGGICAAIFVVILAIILCIVYR